MHVFKRNVVDFKFHDISLLTHGHILARSAEADCNQQIFVRNGL